MNNPKKTVICSIYEKDYEYGLAALINSVISCGFKGEIAVAYKTKLPFWVRQLKNASGYNIYELNGIKISFIKIDYHLHLRYYKSSFILDLLKEGTTEKVYYFDPDITVLGDWQFFEDWLDYGVSLCIDQSYPIMPFSHPIKRKWMEIFEQGLNITPLYKNDYYINSGFIGIKSTHQPLIELWQNFIDYLNNNGHNLKDWKSTQVVYKGRKRLNTFGGDQDILNAALMFSEVEISVIGQEGMGFIPAGYLMYHNTGIKTWNKFFIKNFIKNGNKFSEVDQSYFLNSYSPINLYNKKQRALKAIDISLVKLLQRIF